MYHGGATFCRPDLTEIILEKWDLYLKFYWKCVTCHRNYTGKVWLFTKIIPEKCELLPKSFWILCDMSPTIGDYYLSPKRTKSCKYTKKMSQHCQWDFAQGGAVQKKEIMLWCQLVTLLQYTFGNKSHFSSIISVTSHTFPV